MATIGSGRATMQRILRLWVVGLAVAFVPVGSAAAGAGALTPIGPDQHFIGLVNGSNDHPVVSVVCPGPEAGRRGAVVGGQTLSVAEVANGTGYTGPFSQVYAWFAPKRSSHT